MISNDSSLGGLIMSVYKRLIIPFASSPSLINNGVKKFPGSRLVQGRFIICLIQNNLSRVTIMSEMAERPSQSLVSNFQSYWTAKKNSFEARYPTPPPLPTQCPSANSGTPLEQRSWMLCCSMSIVVCSLYSYYLSLSIIICSLYSYHLSLSIVVCSL